MSYGAETYRRDLRERHEGRDLRERHEREARTLASLTGWGIEKIRNRMGLPAETAPPKWYERIWKG